MWSTEMVVLFCSSSMKTVCGFPGRSVLLLALVLALSSVQCVASCTGKTCIEESKAPPPCHHSEKAPAKDAPSICGHELILADITQAPIVRNLAQSIFTDEHFERTSFRPLTVLNLEAPRQASSPPGLAVISSTVLRI